MPGLSSRPETRSRSPLGKELVQATDALQETFRKQPPPSFGSTQSQAYYGLKQLVRLLHVASNEFASLSRSGQLRCAGC